MSRVSQWVFVGLLLAVVALAVSVAGGGGGKK